MALHTINFKFCLPSVQWGSPKTWHHDCYLALLCLPMWSWFSLKYSLEPSFFPIHSQISSRQGMGRTTGSKEIGTLDRQYWYDEILPDKKMLARIFGRGSMTELWVNSWLKTLDRVCGNELEENVESLFIGLSAAGNLYGVILCWKFTGLGAWTLRPCLLRRHCYSLSSQFIFCQVCIQSVESVDSTVRPCLSCNYRTLFPCMQAIHVSSSIIRLITTIFLWHSHNLFKYEIAENKST